MSEEMLELLKDRDAELEALRAVVDALIYELAEMYSNDQKEKARKGAQIILVDLYYDHGFKSDGRFRGRG